MSDNNRNAEQNYKAKGGENDSHILNMFVMRQTLHIFLWLGDVRNKQKNPAILFIAN
ncbi:MAG: hypothetical protein JRJ86_20365 [Deltaproteobacteria bacterium]|nr:hypothetical protein [Deltaproteobacteria bacterium]